MKSQNTPHALSQTQRKHEKTDRSENSHEWNEALEHAYETFMYDLKSSTRNMSTVSEWFTSPTSPKNHVHG